MYFPTHLCRSRRLLFIEFSKCFTKLTVWYCDRSSYFAFSILFLIGVLSLLEFFQNSQNSNKKKIKKKSLNEICSKTIAPHTRADISWQYVLITFSRIEQQSTDTHKNTESFKAWKWLCAHCFGFPVWH